MVRSALNSLLRYLRTPAARSADQFGGEIEQEIAFHLAERTNEYMAGGFSEENARRAALERFGDPARVAARCHRESVAGLAAWHRLHLAATASLVVLAGLLWLQESSPTSSSLPPGIASMLDNDWTGDVQGQVTDDHGRPIRNAHLLVVVKTWPDGSYFQRAYQAISDSQGRFLIENVYPLNDRYAVQVAAIADDRALKSTYLRCRKGPLAPVKFELPPSSGLDLQVESSLGGALAGVEVLPHGRIEPDGDEHIVYFDSAQPIVRLTDAKGRVQLPYFCPGDTATVMVRVPRGDWQSFTVTAPADGTEMTIRTSSHNLSRFQES